MEEPGSHDAFEDDDLVVVGARGQRGQGLDVRGHVLQVMGPPHRSGQVGPALQHTADGSHLLLIQQVSQPVQTL